MVLVHERSAFDRLVANRADAVRRIASMSSELEAMAAASLGSNSDDEHDPEGSTVAFEREQLAALLARAEHQLAEMDAALDRLAADVYGLCERCARPIAAERLVALPAARLCITCASAGM